MKKSTGVYGVLFLLALLQFRLAWADPGSPDENRLPAILGLMMTPLKNGMFVRMPVVDNDPNRGATFGFMPVWVRTRDGGAIKDIFAPNVTYNPYMGLTTDYTYYYFPNPKTNAQFDASISEKYERDVVLDYNTSSLFGGPMLLNGHAEYSRDASKRFFGIGPNTQESGESNYTLDTINYRLTGGLPLKDGSPWFLNLRHEFQANKVLPGAITKPQDLVDKYPTLGADLRDRHYDASIRAFLSYDTRDSALTTTKGSYGRLFLEGAHNGIIGEYSYYRYGLGFREFWPVYRDGESEPRFITGSRLLIDNLRGSAPIWALPQLGGKYIFRGYGEGRYTDHGVVVFSTEERCRVFAFKFGESFASLWIDPFFEIGTVYPSPELMQSKYLRPAGGISLRGVGRPQVVGSADFGYGQEGLKIFLDINYSY